MSCNQLSINWDHEAKLTASSSLFENILRVVDSSESLNSLSSNIGDSAYTITDGKYLIYDGTNYIEYNSNNYYNTLSSRRNTLTATNWTITTANTNSAVNFRYDNGLTYTTDYDTVYKNRTIVDKVYVDQIQPEININKFKIFENSIIRIDSEGRIFVNEVEETNPAIIGMALLRALNEANEKKIDKIEDIL